MHKLNKKGYTLLEMLVVLFVLTCLSLLSLNYKPFKKDNSVIFFLNDYLAKQTESMTKHKRLSHSLNYSYITFNGKGHINLSRTLIFNKHKLKLYLGSGSFRYE